MRISAFGVAASGLCAFCAVLIFAGGTAITDAAKAAFARPNVDQEPTGSGSEMAAGSPPMTVQFNSPRAELSAVTPESQAGEMQIYASGSGLGSVTPFPARLTSFREAPPLAAATPVNYHESDLRPDRVIILSNEASINVPAGAPLPLAVLASDSSSAFQPPYSASQQEAMERVASDFSREMAEAYAETSPSSGVGMRSAAEDFAQWQTAVSRADERTRAFLGDEIYNRELIREHQILQH